MTYVVVVLKNVLSDLKFLFEKSAKRRVNERYSNHKSFNLTLGERKYVAVDKNKNCKIKI
jgi:hypothetical protein